MMTGDAPARAEALEDRFPDEEDGMQNLVYLLFDYPARAQMRPLAGNDRALLRGGVPGTIPANGEIESCRKISGLPRDLLRNAPHAKFDGVRFPHVDAEFSPPFPPSEVDCGSGRRVESPG